MSKARGIVSLPAGRKIKWVILAFWVVVVLVAGPLAGKVTGAEKNDASSWLPAKAESTKVLDFQSKFQSPNVFPAVVVYDAPSGLTAAGRAKAVADARAFAGVAGVAPGKVAGPFFARDGQAAETIVQVNLGSKGWSAAGPVVTDMRSIGQAGANGMTVHVTGPLGSAADSGNAFKEIGRAHV